MKSFNLIFIVFIAFSCFFREKKNTIDIFNPDFQLTYKDIESQGFKFPYGQVDVAMFTKQFGDTTIAFQFDDSTFSDKSKPSYMWVEFQIDSVSFGEYYWHHNNFVIVCQSKNDAGRDIFTVRNIKSNLYFNASMWKSEQDTTKYKIFIDFYFPKLEQ